MPHKDPARRLKYHRDYRKNRPNGRAIEAIKASRQQARLHGHAPINVTATELARVFAQVTVCQWPGCDRPAKQPDHDRDNFTGKNLRGLLCVKHNMFEGRVRAEIANYIAYTRQPPLYRDAWWLDQNQEGAAT